MSEADMQVWRLEERAEGLALGLSLLDLGSWLHGATAAALPVGARRPADVGHGATAAALPVRARRPAHVGHGAEEPTKVVCCSCVRVGIGKSRGRDPCQAGLLRPARRLPRADCVMQRSAALGAVCAWSCVVEIVPWQHYRHGWLGETALREVLLC
eukprot:21216-Chlamydomonas_euryale.AAC.19